jgi:hypothetical protein
MRNYDHAPDADFAAERYQQYVDRLPRMQTTIARVVPKGDVGVYDVAVNRALDAARYGWALGKPIEDVEALHRRAASWVAEGLDRRRPLDAVIVERWLAIAMIVGDRELAERIADAIPEAVAKLERRSAVGQWFLIGLSALAREDTATATHSAEEMTARLDSAETSPETAETNEALDRLLAATAQVDQADFDAAAAARSAALARDFGRSVEQRRDPNGLLDVQGAAVAAAAHRAGLTLPAGTAYLGSELIERGA